MNQNHNAKKEALGLERQIEKLNERLGGIREMRGLPDLVYVVDVHRETTAVSEANKLGIPIIAIVDTNCDPDPIDYIIPANDDAIRAIKLITSKMADGALEGLAQRKAYEPEEAEEEVGFAVDDEKYLSAATLARLRELQFEEGEEDEDELAVLGPHPRVAASTVEDKAADSGTEVEDEAVGLDDELEDEFEDEDEGED